MSVTVTSFSEARANLKRVMDSVVDDHVPMIITRSKGKEPVVMMSLSDWRGWDETAYLLSSPSNAARLRESIEQLNAGKGIERDLIEP